VLVLLILALFAAALFAWIQNQAGTLFVVHVEGRLKHVTPSEVAAAARPFLHVGFFDLDIHGVHDSVAALPWVDHAQVRRRWPNGVVVHVWERQPVALWGDRSLLTAEGTVFTPTRGTLPTGLPALRGPADTERVLLEGLAHMGDVLAPAGLKVVAIGIDDRGSWNVHLDTGLVLRLGRSQIEERLRRFADTTVPTLGDRLERVAYVDMRYGSGFAVGWREPPPVPQPGEG
jgi:cell division protein FtsQ